MQDTNRALIAKLAWRVMSKSDNLWVKVLAGKYLKGRELGEVPNSCFGSWVWKSILQDRDLLASGACYMIGDCTSVSI